jgi:hypothetical protein
MPAKQKEALLYGAKVPLCYIAIEIANWIAFKKLGIRGVSCPGMYTSGLNLEAPTNIGDYRPKIAPENPILVRANREPCQPGLSAREQQLPDTRNCWQPHFRFLNATSAINLRAAWARADSIPLGTS